MYKMINNKKNQRFFHPSIFPKSRKAQISEGITWIVATIAIIIILLFSVFLSSFFFSKKDTIRSNFFSSNIYQKSFLSYLATKDSSGKFVISQIKNERDLNAFNGNLALKVFRGIYGEKYNVWTGVSKIPDNIDPFISGTLDYVGKENPYFGEKILETVLAPAPLYSGSFQVFGLGTLGSSLYLEKNKEEIMQVIFYEK